MTSVFITRNPVLNRNKAITATRLIIHASNTAQVAAELNALDDTWPGEHTIFVALSGAPPDEGLLAWEPPVNAMIEIPATALPLPETQALMQKLNESMVPMCLSGWTPEAELPPDIEFRFVMADASTFAIGGPGLLIAQGVPDNPAFDDAISQGFGGAEGWFFLHGMIPAKQLSPNHAQLVRLLNLVRNNADIKDIEAALKQDVALSVKLLRYINSAAFGLAVEIQSFRHAVTMLGYDKLHRWLSLLLVTASKDPAAPALMQTAISRGRLMELAAVGYIDKSELDNLFIAGAFSLLDTILGVTMDAALEDMHLPETICDALVSRQGPYAAFLELALACEGSDSGRVRDKTEALQLNADVVNRAHFQALVFADSLQLT